MRAWERLVATGLGTGYLPFAPATFASLLALFFWSFFIPQNQILRGLLVFGIFFYGIYLSHRLVAVWGKDPRRIVVDEVCGMWLVLWLTPAGIWVVFSFLVFRVMDIWKPPPCRQMEAIRGGWGVMLDDVLAACYTVGVIQLLSSIGRLSR
jgi:phosphatidylglycerophosphatase A